MIKNPKREHASHFFEHGILKDEHGDCGGEHGLSTEAKSAHGAGAPSAITQRLFRILSQNLQSRWQEAQSWVHSSGCGSVELIAS